MLNLYKSNVYTEDLKTAVDAVVEFHKFKGCSVLVTGATGTIGSFLVDMFLYANKMYETNITIYALGRSRQRLDKRFGVVKTDQLHFVEHDVNEEIDYDFPVDYIIHAASNAYPASFSNDPVGTVMSNILGTYRMLEYGKFHGTKRFLFVSSGEVYGQGDIMQDAFAESYSGYVDSVQPRSCYPASKRAAETLCVSYTTQYGLESVIVRPCHTYGPNATSVDNRANVQFINNVMNGQDIVLNSAGNQMRSYCYVADCGSAILTVLLNGKNGEAYNSANPNARVTIAEFANIVAEKSGHKLVFADPNAIELAQRTPIARQVLDSKKLENLGWKGQYSVEKGIEHTLAVLSGKS